MIRDLIADHVDEWHVDAMGNLIALKKGTGVSGLRVMVDAHIDEVGLMITGHDSNGTLKFAAVGGFDDRALLGKVVQVGPKEADWCHWRASNSLAQRCAAQFDSETGFDAH